MLYPFGSLRWPFTWKSICQSAPYVWRNHQSCPAEELPVGFSEYGCNTATLYKELGGIRLGGDLAAPLCSGFCGRILFLRKDSIRERWTLHVFGETRKKQRQEAASLSPTTFPPLTCQQDPTKDRRQRSSRFPKIQACLSFSLEFQYSASRVKGSSLEINILLPEGQGDRHPQRYSKCENS